MKCTWILLLGCVLSGCMKQGQRQVEQLERLHGMSMSNILANDRALKELSAKVGLTFPAYSVLVSSTNDTWCVRSEDEIHVPSASAKGTNSLPLAETVRFVEGKFNGQAITHPKSAFSSEWETNGCAFRGTLVRTAQGDYLVIEQFRKK
jgi:hypothetical protein